MTLEEFKDWITDELEAAQAAVKQYHTGRITPNETYWRTKEATLRDIKRHLERVE